MLTINSCVREDQEDGQLKVTVDYIYNGVNHVVTQYFFDIPRNNFIVSLNPADTYLKLVDINDYMVIGDNIAELVLRV